MATFDGRLMGIPGTNPDNSVPVLCWMRKDWLDKLGINPDPDGDLCITLDDIAAVAKAFVDANVSGGNHTVGHGFFRQDIADACASPTPWAATSTDGSKTPTAP